MPVSPILIKGAGLVHFRETVQAAGTHGTREQNKEKTQAVQWWVGLLLKARVKWTNVVGRRNVKAALRSLFHGGPSNGPCLVPWHWKGRPRITEDNG